ncbi:pseudouridine synthase [Leucobacter luti]|uniref:Pseudouridine synthase n=1 Tax=Leucobacter luti TaxID=340320 RepID=A0A4Q7U5K9_9MICO|nr:pseudouridine synthase [Leucobacter luti]
MSRSDSGLGGSFSVDGSDVEVDLAEFGWPGDRAGSDGGRDGADGADGAPEDDGRIRLQKALAHAGIASRRACETLITSGRVTVNGETQRELGSRIDPSADEVRVDGVVVQLDATKRYFVLNKPRGVVSTMSDEDGRPDLREFTDQIDDRLYNVGRLDTDTSGLLILTNDGELAHRLSHPSFGVQKTYVAKVRGKVTPAVIQRLKDGIELSDGPIHADRAKLLPDGSGSAHSLVELTLHSGRNRIVRRMLADVGHPVVELVRRQFGPLHLGTLRIGEMRELAPAERGALLSATSVDDADDTSGGKRGARRPVTSGRPGDGKGAQGMRGIAAKGNPHGRRGPGSDTGTKPGGGRSGGTKPGGQGGRGPAGQGGKPGGGKPGGGRSGGGQFGGNRSGGQGGSGRGPQRGQR